MDVIWFALSVKLRSMLWLVVTVGGLVDPVDDEDDDSTTKGTSRIHHPRVVMCKCARVSGRIPGQPNG